MPNVQAERVSTFDDEDDFARASGAWDGQEAAAAPHTVSIQTVFRGVGMGAKILPFPHEVRQSEKGRWLSIGGIALVATALLTFAVVAASASVQQAVAHSVAIDVAFVLGLVGGASLLVAGLAMRRRARDGADFLVGSAPEVDAPVDPHFVSAAAHRLVTASGDDWIVNATPQMRGAVAVGGQVSSLAELTRDGRTSFRLPPGGEARLVCGATTFVLAAVPPPKKIPRTLIHWRRPETIYTAGAAVALGLFLIVIFSVPPDPRSLSLDLMSNENHLLSFRITPPEEKADLLPAVKTPGAQSGSSGARAAGAEGAMGSRTSKARDRAYSIKGRKDKLDPHLAKATAELRAREAGVLGVIKQMNGPLASIFARDESALGDAAADGLGNLMGSQIGAAAGWGGLGTVGTGSGGGGTNDHLVGMSNGLKIIGTGDGPGGPNRGYGRMAGTLGNRHPIGPEIMPGIASVHGSLDKEIIRRIVRRHVNEVRYCYEQELTKRPALTGRIVVQFMIAGNGQVLSSVLQSSTMGNSRVESCTVQAVHRWSFPEPQGGGLVTVTYPFSLTPAG